MTIFYTSIYNDGTKFTFSEDDSGKGSYAEIDRTKLEKIEIYNDTKLLHRLHLENGQRLILRSRTIKEISAKYIQEAMGKETPLEKLEGKMRRIILIGYQETISQENRQSITIIFLDDFHTENISKWKEAPLNSVILTEDEKLG